MENKIVILTHTDNFFGQTRKPWVSMDINKILAEFANENMSVHHYNIHEVFNKNIELRDKIIIYSFSQKENVRNYIKDIIYFLSHHNRIIPSLDLLYCHEDKGYQELLKKRLGFDSLNALYFSSFKDLRNYDIKYPVVLKTVDGSNGKGVFLIHSKKELYKKIHSLNNRGNLLTSLDLLRRKYLRKKKFKHYPGHDDREDYYQYRHYITREKNYILQEYIPGLDHDYRILVLYDKYYITKRHVNKGDFRASGTKKFDFNFKVDYSLLDYAKNVFAKFNTPILSIDIMSRNNKYYLGEYQALHFGINVFIKSNGYYIKAGDTWKFIENKSHIEKELAMAFIKYIKTDQV